MTEAEKLTSAIGSKWTNTLGKQGHHTSFSLLKLASYFGTVERTVLPGKPTRIEYRFADGSKLWRFAASGLLFHQ